MSGENLHPVAMFARRIVAFEEEVRGIRDQIRGIYTEAKDGGHLKGAVRGVVKRLLETEA